MNLQSHTAARTDALVAQISAELLDAARLLGLLEEARSVRCGGLVLFSGEVREFNHGQTVARLEYEAYTALAVKTMREILTAAAERWSLGAAGCIHRVGTLTPGESAVLVVTAAAHRAEAYAANQYVIQRVKHEAPIWQKEVYADGTHVWGHNCEH